ncbi:NADH dehydrogenase [Paraliobacillus quinghaiensis]|uniref:NADH:ubiquinone reductase (non-electrogenic) n=1 Tax=Paraliobacillus quinghaiensis TaxID=470815 RepID=A0A917TTG0_9BACI|nr:NAD(P)/FAD-dependent oxidoreductase [Paraliobacillus quinghaiensis]GGM36523.1 NADH dehydrogenase [Paraliobacillus quinghaiensis]
MANKNIVIIGAGYAGVHAAQKLAKKYKKDDAVTITLIDRHSYHTMMTELHEVAAHRVEPEAIQFDLRRLFNRTKVNLVTDNVTHVDHDKKKVLTEDGEYDFDYLILGMGGEPNDFGTPGVGENGFTLWSWEDSVKLREHIEKTVSRAALVKDEATRRAMLTFTVCGSGFTGIEMVGELVEWKERLAKDNKIDAEEITLYVVEAAPTILNMLERRDADKAEAYLVKNGVKILKDSPIVEVKKEEIVLKSGETIPTHTLIWTAGVKANSDTKDYGMSTGRAGRLKVNQYMESEDFDNVYVIGDLAYYEEEEGKPTPQIVEAAEQTGTTAAKSIIAEISGGEKEAYEGKYHGTMVSIGARYGVADLMGVHLSGWFANFMKHMVNLYYFFGISSGYYMVQYIRHEFFETKDKRNIFRDFLTRYGNVLWSFPLRLFVGGFWLVEAGMKIWGKDTWEQATSSFSNLGQLFNGLGEGSWLVGSTVRMPFEWLQTATSGASEAGEASEWATPILSRMPGIFEWFMQIVMPTPEVAVFMQKFMVFVELAIGLALVAGLFTWLASAASAAFLVTFTLSAMLGWDKVWALPASIALLNGSGRTLGLDYWVIPYLQRKLGNWWYGKEQSIYQDKK